MSAPTAVVFLTKQETQLLRRLIVEEVRRLDPDHWFRERELKKNWPASLRRILPVAKKIWEARQSFDGES